MQTGRGGGARAHERAHHAGAGCGGRGGEGVVRRGGPGAEAGPAGPAGPAGSGGGAARPRRLAAHLPAPQRAVEYARWCLAVFKAVHETAAAGLVHSQGASPAAEDHTLRLRVVGSGGR